MVTLVVRIKIFGHLHNQMLKNEASLVPKTSSHEVFQSKLCISYQISEMPAIFGLKNTFMYWCWRSWAASFSSICRRLSARSESTPPEAQASQHSLSPSNTGRSSRYLKYEHVCIDQLVNMSNGLASLKQEETLSEIHRTNTAGMNST